MGNRYAIFSAQYFPHIGGIEKYTENLARELSSEGNSVDIITNNTEGLQMAESCSGDVQVIRLPCISLFNGRLPLPMFNSETRLKMNELKKRKYAGVLINARFYPHTFIGLDFAKAVGVRPIVLDHGSDYLTFANPVVDLFVRAYEEVVTKAVKRWKPCFYGVSEKSVAWLGHFGILACGVLGNSIDAELFRSLASDRNFRNEVKVSEDAVLVAFTGRLIPEKGVQTILDAARILKDRGIEDIYFVMAGNGPLEDKVLNSGLKNISFVGPLSASDISALLQQSDAFCLPSRSEGFSTSLLEASACGLPSFVSDVGGARELFPDDSYGCILPSMDPKCLADTLAAVCVDRTFLSTMGNRCRMLVEEKYSWKAASRQFVLACEDAQQKQER